jgi:hypothetical protein
MDTPRGNRLHELKKDPEVFHASLQGNKPWEIRYNDRRYQVGDHLTVRETKFSGEDMKKGKALIYTGRYLCLKVTYLLKGYGLQDGWVIMSVEPV